MTHLAMETVTRPIIGIENRTAQEVFDIMCDRFKGSAPKCHVQEYGKSDGSKDYFVAVTVGGRTITPHMHRIRGRAEYEVAEWEWLLNGGPKPEFDQFELDAAPSPVGGSVS